LNVAGKQDENVIVNSYTSGIFIFLEVISYLGVALRCVPFLKYNISKNYFDGSLKRPFELTLNFPVHANILMLPSTCTSYKHGPD